MIALITISISLKTVPLQLFDHPKLFFRYVNISSIFNDSLTFFFLLSIFNYLFIFYFLFFHGVVKVGSSLNIGRQCCKVA